MPEVTRFVSTELPAGVSLWHIPVTALPHTSSRRIAEQEAVKRLVMHCFGPDTILTHASDGAPILSPQQEGLYISISHSKDEAWLAVSTTGPVGIDAETPRQQLVRVARRFLSTAEIERNPGMDELLYLWTAKEAIYKVARTPGLDPREISVTRGSATLADGRRFSLVALAPGLTLALAAK